MEKKNNNGIYEPRPEPEQIQWGDSLLLEPTKKAVEGLLCRLHGAVKARDKYDQFASTFLLTGERGTGKTTVLLCAKRAIEDTEKFFANSNNNISGITMREIEDIGRNVVWLDRIDLELIRGTANPLTALLARIQGALDIPRSGRCSARRTASLLDDEEEVSSKLNRLIQDATLMWEDIQESSVHDRAHQQIRAAEIYARFQREFRDAVECAAKSLGRLDHRKGEKVLVLPIDNVDRSAEHVKSIFKLARLVSSKHLWLVLVGYSQDMRTFLEWAYRQELVIKEEAPRPDGTREDYYARVIPRHQAAATERVVAPLLQEVKVDFVEPRDALKFALDGERELKTLLRNIGLPSLEEEINKPKEHSDTQREPPKTLLDLIDMSAWVRVQESASGAGAPAGDKQCHGTSDKLVLSTAGQYALRMPARTLVDLWLWLSQLNAAVSGDAPSPTGDRSEKPSDDRSQTDGRSVEIVRKVLRTSLSEANISNEIYAKIQNEMILRDFIIKDDKNVNKSTRLNLEDVSLDTYALSSHLMKYNVSGDRSADGLVQSLIQVVRLFPPSIRVFLRDHPEQRPMSLPPLVAGWLMLLWDILELSGPPYVVTADKETLIERRRFKQVMTTHTVILRDLGPIEAELVWRTPAFYTYFDADVFREQWGRFMDRLTGEEGVRPLPRLELADLIAAAWIDCASSVLRHEHGGWCLKNVLGHGRGDNSYDYLDEVMRQLSITHEDNEKKNAKNGKYPCKVSSLHAEMVRDWMEGDVLAPLLPEMSGTWRPESPLCKELLRQFQKLPLAVRKRAGWARFDRVRRALELGLRSATERRDGWRPAAKEDRRTERRLTVHIVGQPEALAEEVVLSDAASVLAGWLLGEFGPFYVGHPDLAVGQFLPHIRQETMP